MSKNSLKAAEYRYFFFLSLFFFRRRLLKVFWFILDFLFAVVYVIFHLRISVIWILGLFFFSMFIRLLFGVCGGWESQRLSRHISFFVIYLLFSLLDKNLLPSSSSSRSWSMSLAHAYCIYDNTLQMSAKQQPKKERQKCVRNSSREWIIRG